MITEKSNLHGRGRSFAMLLLRVAIGMVLLYLLLHFVEFSDIARSFKTARLDCVAGAACLVIANLGLQILKWRYFVRLVNPGSSNLETAAALLFGLSLGTLTPGQIGEFGGRALRHDSVSSGTVIGLMMIDKLQMLCVMGIGGGIGSLFLFHLLGFPYIALIGITSGIFFYLFFNPNTVFKLGSLLHHRLLSFSWAQDFMSAVSVFRPINLLVSAAFSVAFYSVIYFQMFLLLNAFSDVSMADAFLGFSAMMLFKSLLPISFGDLGTREASSVYLYSLRGIAYSTSFNAAILMFVINILFPSLLGLAFTPKFSSK